MLETGLTAGWSRSATATTRRSPSASRAAAPSTSSSNRSTGRPSAVDLRGLARGAPRRATRRARHGDRGPAPRRQAAGPSRGTTPLGTLGDPDLDRVVGTRRARRARGGPHRRAPLRRARRGATRPSVSVFIESFAPPPQMLIFGAVDFTAALGQGREGARLPGDRVRRPRGVRHPRRFPMADEVVVDWPEPAARPRRVVARPPRRRLHPDPRPEVRRARDRSAR